MIGPNPSLCRAAKIYVRRPRKRVGPNQDLTRSKRSFLEIFAFFKKVGGLLSNCSSMRFSWTKSIWQFAKILWFSDLKFIVSKSERSSTCEKDRRKLELKDRLLLKLWSNYILSRLIFLRNDPSSMTVSRVN